MNKRQSVRTKALKVLELAKSQNHKTILLPKGYTPDFEKLKMKCKKNK
jgi:hypothetical protein